jgi:hypothetical protein
MSAHAYTKGQLVGQPAIGLFAELGWATVLALEETLGAPHPAYGHSDSLTPARSTLRAQDFAEFLSPLPKRLKSPRSWRRRSSACFALFCG